MTLSFHKVKFDAEEVLDLIAEVRQWHNGCDCGGLADLEETFIQQAEERSRA